ncbi:MAG: hypothetical protein NUV91_02415, partial [Candidatus Omnitrophica bacterium]|nr:hypothetical protein [Candidatus Omnitrophota bacterium]
MKKILLFRFIILSMAVLILPTILGRAEVLAAGAGEVRRDPSFQAASPKLAERKAQEKIGQQGTDPKGFSWGVSQKESDFQEVDGTNSKQETDPKGFSFG